MVIYRKMLGLVMRITHFNNISYFGMAIFQINGRSDNSYLDDIKQ